jgi:hypothetical protein
MNISREAKAQKRIESLNPQAFLKESFALRNNYKGRLYLPRGLRSSVIYRRLLILAFMYIDKELLDDGHINAHTLPGTEYKGRLSFRELALLFNQLDPGTILTKSLVKNTFDKLAVNTSLPYKDTLPALLAKERGFFDKQIDEMKGENGTAHFDECFRKAITIATKAREYIRLKGEQAFDKDAATAGRSLSNTIDTISEAIKGSENYYLPDCLHITKGSFYVTDPVTQQGYMKAGASIELNLTGSSDTETLLNTTLLKIASKSGSVISLDTGPADEIVQALFERYAVNNECVINIIVRRIVGIGRKKAPELVHRVLVRKKV